MTVFPVQKGLVYWASVPWMDPCGFHKSIIPLPASAPWAGGSSDCGHTAQLPVWMNCSKVMSCTKSLPGNKARQISMHCNCARNSASGPQTLAHLWGIFWRACHAHAARVVLVVIDNFWPVSDQHSPSNPLNTVYSYSQPTASSSHSVASFCSTLSFSPPPFELLSSFFQGDQFLSSDV